MREFFIESFEKLIGVIVIVMAAVVVIGGLVTMFSQSFIGGIVTIIVGGLYVIMMGGMLYLALGVYHNTKRTAEAVERLENK